VFDFTGVPSLTSYTLSNTPLTFIANISALPQQYTNDQILWSYGDNTFDTSLTGVHVYDTPGVYNVTCWVYDLSGNSYKSTYSTDIVIQDFVKDSVCFSVSTNISLTSGRIDQPILINRSNSQRAPVNTTISFTSSGCCSSFFELGLDTNKYGHLLPYSSFYKLVSSEDTYEFVEIDSLETRNNTTLYCIISNNNISICPATTPGSIFCGTSGFDYVYFKSDNPSSKTNLFCWYDGKNQKLNTSVCGISCQVIRNNDIHEFSITSTGIDGEGRATQTYDIDTTKFVNEKIYFVVKLKDSLWYSVKWPNIYTLSPTFSCVIVDSNGVVIPTKIEPNFTLHNPSSGGGYFKGSIVPKHTCVNARISAFGIVEGKVLQGVSNTFTIHPSSGAYDIAKKNEDFDWTQTMKDLCFQEVLIDSTTLFDDFIGTIFEGVSSKPSDVGKLPWERIVNFVDNNQSIDFCNIDKLYSICKSIGFDIKDTRANINYPPQIKRLLDIISIKYERLVGTTNKFDENFDRRGDYDIETYGTNIGDKLNVLTDYVTGGDYYIIAQEKFSGNFTKCNTHLLSSGVVVPLSTYSPDWGWNLVLGNNITGDDISKYYTFYTYVSGTSTEIIDSVFDYKNPQHNSTITSSNWESDGGVIDNMLIYQFLTNTNIISSY
jgi:hypothetical protein